MTESNRKQTVDNWRSQSALEMLPKYQGSESYTEKIKIKLKPYNLVHN